MKTYFKKQIYYISVRVIAGYRLVKGRTIYKTKVVVDPITGKKSKRNYISHTTKDRHKAYYRIVTFPRTRKLSFQKLAYISKKVKIVESSGAVMSPHPLHFERTTLGGRDSGTSVKFYRTSNPSDKGVTNIVGMISGTHSGAATFGTTIGFLNHYTTNSIVDPISAGALYRLANNARDGIANLTNMFAEREGLKKTFGQWAVGLLRTLVAGKRAILHAASDIASDPKKIANVYLGYIYGVKPAISDFSNIFRELGEEQRTWRAYKGYNTSKWSETTSGSNGPSKWVITRNFELTVKHMVRVSGTASNPVLSNHSHANILGAAWEVIPWSFVADWFIPIGAFLDSQDLFSGVQVSSWHRTITYKESYSLVLSHSGDYGGYTFSGSSQTFTGERVVVDRKIMSGTPSLPFPQFKSPISTSHLVTSLMLLISQLKR